ncbi:MAG: hypothetical protein MMC33_004681 [Icmadophila ericetorum]|nr:hypothetical protein [Icmadophila ericetorum]
MAPDPGIQTGEFKEKAQKDLLRLLEGVRGKKNLVIEKGLAGPVGLFVKFSTLQEYGVDKVFFLENDNVDSSQKNVVFLARGENAARAISISEQIKRLQKDSSIEHEFSILVAPRRTLVCNKILEDAGVLGDVSVEEFPLYFMPLEQDVLSLELEDSFADLYLHKDPTSTFLAAKALWLLQQKHGLFPRILGKGDNAHRLMELLIRMRSEAAAEDSGASRLGMMPSASIESLIIIDREVDFATVLLTQLTYEGLIDEQFGIQNNQAEVETSIVGPPRGQSATARPQQGLKRKIQLDSTDTLYEQIRNSNVAVVGPLLNKVAKRLASDIEGRHGKNTAELRDFVNKLPGYQDEQHSLKVHTGLAEEIMKYTQSDLFTRILEVQQTLAAGADPSSQHENIEELISRDTPLPVVLRLLCIESCIAGGIKPKDLENFKRLIVHAYGYQHLLTFHALEKMHLLETRTGANVPYLPIGGGGGGSPGTKTNYNYLRKALRLIVDEVNEQNPDDIAYVYSGYAPLSVRLVQCILQKPYLLGLIKGTATANPNAPSTATNVNGVSSAAHGWQGFEDALKNVRGETFNKVQKGEEAASKARTVLAGTGGKKTVVVMFLGGITFTEIAALRFVAEREKERRRILICTTGLLSGGRMMDVATEKGSFGGKVSSA